MGTIVQPSASHLKACSLSLTMRQVKIPIIATSETMWLPYSRGPPDRMKRISFKTFEETGQGAHRKLSHKIASALHVANETTLRVKGLR